MHGVVGTHNGQRASPLAVAKPLSPAAYFLGVTPGGSLTATEITPHVVMTGGSAAATRGTSSLHRFASY